MEGKGKNLSKTDNKAWQVSVVFKNYSGFTKNNQGGYRYPP